MELGTQRSGEERSVQKPRLGTPQEAHNHTRGVYNPKQRQSPGTETRSQMLNIISRLREVNNPSACSSSIVAEMRGGRIGKAMMQNWSEGKEPLALHYHTPSMQSLSLWEEVPIL